MSDRATRGTEQGGEGFSHFKLSLRFVPAIYQRHFHDPCPIND
jgi:hypothetical protein